MKKYAARINRRLSCSAEIEEVEVERETKHYVWINGRRNAKQSEWRSYYDTWIDAHTAILSQQQQYVAQCESRFKDAFDRLVEIENMENPEKQNPSEEGIAETE